MPTFMDIWCGIFEDFFNNNTSNTEAVSVVLSNMGSDRMRLFPLFYCTDVPSDNGKDVSFEHEVISNVKAAFFK